MDLQETLTHLEADYDVYAYLVVRKEFLNFIADVNGVIFDAHRAFQLLVAELSEKQEELHKRRDAGMQFTRIEDAAWHSINDLTIERNVAGGGNPRFVGNFCIVVLFHYWEDYIRPRIAQIFRVEVKEVTHPHLGDIRNFRNAIIHNTGVATEDVEANLEFRFYKRGDLIDLAWEKYVEISQAITGAILDHQLIPEVAKDLADKLRSYKDL